MSDSRYAAVQRFLAVPILILAIVLAASPVLALGTEPRAEETASLEASPYILGADELVLEEREGYRSDYLFSMSKSVMRSTLVPALKPLTLLLTVPIDLVVLPFAAIAGFF